LLLEVVILRDIETVSKLANQGCAHHHRYFMRGIMK